MGKILKKFKDAVAAKTAASATPAAGPKAPHTADWLYQKHKADQGLADAPADPLAPSTPAAPVSGAGEAPAGGGVASAPAGGMVLSDQEERLRRKAGLQI